MKKGFTLIELLAVIVILAIIALIAVPIVLNIINDAKESSLLRSAEFYLDAVEYVVADAFLYHGGLSNGQYPITLEGNICKKALPCDDANTLKVEVNGDKPTGGYIELNGGVISNTFLLLGEKRIILDEENNLAYDPNVCTLIRGNKTTTGSKYLCEVSPGINYNFYVLSQESDGTTNLIMDRNICDDGSLTEDGKTCLVAYIESGDATGVGPVTAMTYLNNATSTWENIDNLDITYDDEGKNFTGFEINGKARLPYKSEVNDFNNNNGYLYEYLNDSFWNYDDSTRPVNKISGIEGYWTMDTTSDASSFWIVYFIGDIYPTYGNSYGVRPVINVKL